MNKLELLIISDTCNMEELKVLMPLSDVCDCSYPDRTAIEYHSFESVLCINYSELESAKKMIHDSLVHIEHFEFIGLNFDVINYCVPSLMLGIMNSGHAFINLPKDLSTRKQLVSTLNVQYMFTTNISDGEVLRTVRLHGQDLHLAKLLQSSKTIHRLCRHSYAYGIATSGTTGSPKVVRVPYSSIVPNILDLKKIFQVTIKDKIAQLTNFTFDPSIVEIFLAFSAAATLFMASAELKCDACRLLPKIHSSQVSILQMTPSVFFYTWSSEQLKTTILSENTNLRVLLLGGEPFPKIDTFFNVLHPQNHTRIFNIYGITEVSCWASVNELSKFDVLQKSNDLGEVLSNTIFQIRNEEGKILKTGKGILHVGSSSRICVVDNETIDDLEKPLFRNTGDIVEMSTTGKTLYIGRANNIIKRFGNKMDILKLENTVLELSYIKNCYTVWDANIHKLHLCVTITKAMAAQSDIIVDIVKHLEKLQPFYKPDKVHILDSLELTSSGKMCIDALRRKLLNDDVKERNEVDVQMIKQIFQSIWEESLKLDDQGFLKLGGTSIIALQMSNEVSKALHTEFPELIGMLLRDSTYHECLTYIIRKTSSIWDTNSTERLMNSYLNSEPTTSSNRQNQNERLPSTSFTLYQAAYLWHRCRGSAYGMMPIPDENFHSLPQTISRVEILKSFDLKKCVDASPTIFQYTHNLFATVGSHSGIICTVQLNEESFTSYEVKLKDRIEASILILDDFKGVVGCYDGHVYCVNLKTAEIVWKFLTGDIVKCAAILCNHRRRIFFGSYDFHAYCVSADTGAEIWRTKCSNGSISASGCLHSQSASVLFGTLDGTCLALHESTGKILWKNKLGNPIFVSPCVLKSGLVLFCTVAGEMSCFDIESNIQMWRYVIDGNVFSYPLTRYDFKSKRENVILGSQNKKIYYFEVDQTNIVLRHVLHLHAAVFSTTWWERDFLFIACTDGTLSVHNFSTNKLLKLTKLPGEVFSSPVVYGDLLVVGCRDNNTYIFKLFE